MNRRQFSFKSIAGAALLLVGSPLVTFGRDMNSGGPTIPEYYRPTKPNDLVVHFYAAQVINYEIQDTEWVIKPIFLDPDQLIKWNELMVAYEGNNPAWASVAKIGLDNFIIHCGMVPFHGFGLKSLSPTTVSVMTQLWKGRGRDAILRGEWKIPDEIDSLTAVPSGCILAPWVPVIAPADNTTITKDMIERYSTKKINPKYFMDSRGSHLI